MEPSRELSSIERIIIARTKGWMRDNNWKASDWAVAMIGEAGEYCNLVKKLNRLNAGIKDYKGETLDEIRAKMADELADVFVYLVLNAHYMDIDLEGAVNIKFNRDSEKRGLPERL